jgi:hypothetical protein
MSVLVDIAIPIELDEGEWRQAALVGVMRNIEDILAGRKHRGGAQPKDGWRYNIEGACGELVVAKYLRTPWSGALGDLKAADVGRRIQVRTRSRHDYELFVYRNDPPEHAFVLVTGLAPRFVLRGWCYGSEGKEWGRWWAPPGREYAFFVSQDDLHHMDSLPREYLE